jgi:ABC-type Fe3+/spermidine/putrescine transport system ATPase subunit
VGVTGLYVTHDQEEAFAIADRVAIMRARLEAGEGGRVEQIGTPQEVYRQPAGAYVARFLGFRNLIEGRVASIAPSLQVDTPIGRLAVTGAAGSLAVGDRAHVLIRPEAAELTTSGSDSQNVVAGTLVDRSFRGSYYLIRTEHDRGEILTLEVPATDGALVNAGDGVTLRLDPAAISLLPA